MRIGLRCLASLSLCLLASSAHARDTRHLLPIEKAIELGRAQEKLDGSVSFYFGKATTPKVIIKYDQDIANRKTNGVGKSDEEACNWVMLSCLVALQDTAKARGANAVINIESYYKKVTYSSETSYECHAGTFVTGVALRGTYAKVAQ
jgi:uncharacterized protein YbjQ (UPF0145 family)